MAQNTSSSIHGKIHESLLPLLEAKFRNINKKLKGQGQIGYKVVGTVLGPYTDVNGERHDDGLYFQIETEGAARFQNMEYIGKIDVTGGDTNTIRPYAKIDESEYQTMMDFHGTECACCSTSRKRNELYAFRCTETSTNPETGAIYEKGKIYPVGSSCVDKFTGVHALDIIQELSGEIDLQEKDVEHRKVKPSHLDAKKFMQYAMAVSNSGIDEAFSFYRRHRSFHNDSAENIYDVAMASPKTYRTCIGTTVEEMTGNITRTAVAAYHLCEDGYVDRSFFKNDEQLQMFKDLLRVSSFEERLPMMERTAQRIKDLYATDIQSDNMYLKLLGHNMGALANTEFIHDSHAQKLVDVCDAYFLQRGSCAMHEDKTVPYEVDDYGSIEGRFVIGRTPDGKPKETTVKINNCEYYGHSLNSVELTKLYNGYPVILEDCQNNGRPFKAVVSIQESYTGKHMLRMDNRFTRNGQIDREALKRYRPPYPPENARITTTYEKPHVSVSSSTQKVSQDMKTGEKDRRYTSSEIAAKKFHYYPNSNLVKGAGQFEITTSDANLADAMRKSAADIAEYVGDNLGLEEKKDNPQTILISDVKEKRGEYSFKIAYSGFPEDNQSARMCQKEIQTVVADMFAYDSFEMSSAKPISDVELLKILKEHNGHGGRGGFGDDDGGGNSGGSGSTPPAATITLNEHLAPTVSSNDRELSM